ncbi:uncharacterized protein TNIN_317161 [Trichonephila inaurata madagascariensis]|uniref:DUF19 domain-containing protein n=1 Tax=Trichonephila inaurata madagascariensis TaxID=2747483 RepID=A0A8X6MBA7_9ARAC|nr:uncharacterized protein TNIN_317161 [Trichonephila inaurata madagascariensis]
MWVYILFMAVSAKVALGDVNCTMSPSQECENLDIIKGIPATAAEFEELCPEVQTLVTCLREYDVSCPDGRYSKMFEDEHYFNLRDLLTELCNPESQLHKDVAENIKCYSETFKNAMCSAKAWSVIEPYIDTDSFGIFPKRISCLREVFVGSCLANDISNNCNSAAKDAALEIFRRAIYLKKYCTAENAQELLDEMDNFGLEEENKELVTRTLRKLIQTDSNVTFSFL